MKQAHPSDNFMRIIALVNVSCTGRSMCNIMGFNGIIAISSCKPTYGTM